ncbi:MAG: tRNA 2-thiouridine(34) synthase MnmA [Clostridia bacterium]|nr:tRNA 2-thiouridine(34) synthase MnmA [Clostridia bacterium]
MNKILLGLSGGVDSAVAAAKLIEQGFEVTGCFLLLTENSNENSEEAKNAAIIAQHLGIRLVTADFRERFKENVGDYFIKEYLAGRTPNPCIKCNPTVKIRSLIDTANSLNIDKIATGHYALTEKSEKYKGVVLKAAPSKKDQSYFLCRLSPEQIEKVVFPLGEFSSKEDVRLAAEKLSLPNAKKADSQEICFIPDNNYQKYICENSDFVPSPGNFLDNSGNIIGKHTGIINYTVGQRKGLGAFGEARYVKEINARDNTVTLCKKDERFAFCLEAGDISWAVNAPPEGSFEGKVKIRNTANPADAIIAIKNNKIKIQFKDKVLAPTPGQSAVIYDGDIVLGGGIIL